MAVTYTAEPAAKAGRYQLRRGKTLVIPDVGREEAWREARRLARGASGNAVLTDRRGRVCCRNVYRAEIRFELTLHA